jgi:ribosome-associated heat shock protein Hsp15
VSATDDSDGGALRVDRWLWCTRFFKTRGAAAEAVRGGHVHVNRERVKPSRALRVGDVLDITRAREHFHVTVLGIPERRGPAREAATFYEEDPASRARREAAREALALDRRLAPSTDGRPDRRTRRELRRLLGRDD